MTERGCQLSRERTTARSHGALTARRHWGWGPARAPRRRSRQWSALFAGRHRRGEASRGRDRIAPREDDFGFTIIEILVAMLLLTIVLAGSLAMQLTMIRASRDSRMSSGAMTVAQSKLEALRSMSYQRLQTEVAANPLEDRCFAYDTKEVIGCGTGTFYRRRATVAYAVAPNTGIDIRVRVFWRVGEGQQTRQFSAALHREE